MDIKLKTDPSNLTDLLGISKERQFEMDKFFNENIHWLVIKGGSISVNDCVKTLLLEAKNTEEGLLFLYQFGEWKMQVSHMGATFGK